MQLPSHVETMISLANTSRRHGTIDDAVAVYAAQLESPAADMSAKAAVVAEWAHLLWKIKHAADEARAVFHKYQAQFMESEAFWKGYLQLEIGQPTTAETEKEQYDRIKAVADTILNKSKLSESTVQSLITIYMAYLLEKGGKEAAKEYLNLDREINGPPSVQKLPTTKPSATSKAAAGVNGQVSHAFQTLR